MPHAHFTLGTLLKKEDLERSLIPSTENLLRTADIPLKKAVAGVRVGLLPDLGFVINPTVQQMEQSQLDLVMAGTDSAVLMIEGYCDFLTEEQMLEVQCHKVCKS